MNDRDVRDYYKQFCKFKDAFATRRAHYKEIAEYIYPEYGYALDDQTQRDKGDKKHDKVMNGAAAGYVDRLASFLQENLTSVTKPWFELTISDKDLLEYKPVRIWLDDQTNFLLDVFSRSNFYSANMNNWREMIMFGPAVMLIDEDWANVIRCRPFNMGEYYLANDSRYEPNILFREFLLTAFQIIEKFGIDNVNPRIKDAYNRNDKEREFKVIQCIQPNAYIDITKAGPEGMQYESAYFLESGHEDKFLSIKGYPEKPFISPRWQTVGVDVWGFGQGQRALGDIKQLMAEEIDTAKALKKIIDPPMTAPSSLKNEIKTLVPGGVTYVDAMQGQQGFQPTYQFQFDFQKIAFAMDRLQNRIKDYFFNDLILLLSQRDREITATEAIKIDSEKFQVLGSIVLNCQEQLLDKAITRTFNIANRMGYIRPMPEEMIGRNIKIEYISYLARIQKMVNITAINQFVGFIGNIAGVVPTVVDKFDADQSVDEIADLLNVSPRLVRSDDEVEEIRQIRMIQQEQARQQEMLMNMTQGAKNMSETQFNNNSMLDALMSRYGG